MIFEELNRIKDRDRHLILQNPHAKSKHRRLRRAEARQTRLEARSLGAAANKNIGTIDTAKKSA